MIFNMEMERRLGQMDQHIKDNTIMDSSRVMASTCGRMETYSKALGIRTSYKMDQLLSSLHLAQLIRVISRIKK